MGRLNDKTEKEKEPAKGKDFSHKVTPQDVAEYEKERLGRIEHFRKSMKGAVGSRLDMPTLNPDGSLTEEAQEKMRKDVAASTDAWRGEAKNAD